MDYGTNQQGIFPLHCISRHSACKASKREHKKDQGKQLMEYNGTMVLSQKTTRISRALLTMTLRRVIRSSSRKDEVMQYGSTPCPS